MKPSLFSEGYGDAERIAKPKIRRFNGALALQRGRSGDGRAAKAGLVVASMEPSLFSEGYCRVASLSR